MKKIISLLLVLCIMISVVPVFAAVIPDNWMLSGQFWVEVNNDIWTIMTIADFKYGNVTVPYSGRLSLKKDITEKTGDVFEVNKIILSPDMFKNGGDRVEKITFEEGFTELPTGLCEGMKNLKTVNLPKSITAISDYCFKDCEILETIDLSHVKYIGRGAFEGCKNLKSVTLSDECVAIEDYAFYGCESLEVIEGLNDTVNVGNNAFENTALNLKNEEYFYLAQEAFKNQDEIVEISVTALSWYDADNETYNFTTSDKEIISTMLLAIDSVRYKEVKGNFSADTVSFLIKASYPDGKEASMVFKLSSERIDDKKYQIMEEDFWKLEGLLKEFKKSITSKDEFTDTAEKADTLLRLGILESYEEGIVMLSDLLTRAEAAVIMIRLLKLDDEIQCEETIFTDVDSSYWASGYINRAVEYGIINGQGDGTFDPNEYVTYEQMIKMVVCVLGYEPLAMANGGWKNGGYTFAASKIGLIEENDMKGSKLVSKGDAAKIVYNALDIELMDYNVCFPPVTFEILENETLMTAYWECAKVKLEVKEYVKGSVKCVVKDFIGEPDGILGGQLIRLSTDYDLSEYVGGEITAYVKENKAGDDILMLIVNNEE